jgi:hypothetical protein
MSAEQPHDSITEAIDELKDVPWIAERDAFSAVHHALIGLDDNLAPAVNEFNSLVTDKLPLMMERSRQLADQAAGIGSSLIAAVEGDDSDLAQNVRRSSTEYMRSAEHHAHVGSRVMALTQRIQNAVAVIAGSLEELQQMDAPMSDDDPTPGAAIAQLIDDSTIYRMDQDQSS